MSIRSRLRLENVACLRGDCERPVAGRNDEPSNRAYTFLSVRDREWGQHLNQRGNSPLHTLKDVPNYPVRFNCIRCMVPWTAAVCSLLIADNHPNCRAVTFSQPYLSRVIPRSTYFVSNHQKHYSISQCLLHLLIPLRPLTRRSRKHKTCGILSKPVPWQLAILSFLELWWQ